MQELKREVNVVLSVTHLDEGVLYQGEMCCAEIFTNQLLALPPALSTASQPLVR